MPRTELIQGDCLEKMHDIPDCSVDAIVTDPPYELGFMGKRWDHTGVAYNVELWKECLRVLKPGAHLLAFGGTRTYHRMAVAIEDAGFEVRDMLEWIYASGFPKSLNVGKVMNKYLQTGNASWNGTGDSSNGALGYAKLQHKQGYRPKDYSNAHQSKENINEEQAKQWEGWGTALKPAHEPIVMARKPLSEKTIVENCLKHGTGAIDIDGCRIPTSEPYEIKGGGGGKGTGWGKKEEINEIRTGRFPANIICTDDALNDGVMTKGVQRTGKRSGKHSAFKHAGQSGVVMGHNDSGSKSRYFDIECWAEKHGLLQFPKASKKDRGEGNTHATVKPTHLLAWLVRLVSKEGDTVLDPFMGSGTTGVACRRLNRNFVGIELDPEYFRIAEVRAWWGRNPIRLA